MVKTKETEDSEVWGIETVEKYSVEMEPNSIENRASAKRLSSKGIMEHPETTSDEMDRSGELEDNSNGVEQETELNMCAKRFKIKTGT